MGAVLSKVQLERVRPALTLEIKADHVKFTLTLWSVGGGATPLLAPLSVLPGLPIAPDVQVGAATIGEDPPNQAVPFGSAGLPGIVQSIGERIAAGSTKGTYDLLSGDRDWLVLATPRGER
jgi:hypothetical protein